MENAFQYLVTLLSDKFEISPSDMRGDATLAEIGLDSLAAAELHVTLQDEWGTHGEQGEITEKLTLNQAADVLRAWTAGRSQTPSEPAP